MGNQLLIPVVGLVVVLITCYLYVPFYYWKVRYMYMNYYLNSQKKNIKNETDKEVVCIHCNQLFYVKNIYNNKKRSFNCWWRWWVKITRVKEIWLSHGPRGNITDALMKCVPSGTTIHIGRVVRYTRQDRQALKILVRKGYKLEVWQDEANKVDQKYKTHLRDYIELLKYKHTYMRDVVKIASAELLVTHLLTNNKDLYRSEKGKHAEVKFSEDTVHPESVERIWIENSPCAKCSSVLMDHFRDVKKPELLIGKAYKPYKEKNIRGMADLEADGFSLGTWNDYIAYTDSQQQTLIAKYISDL